MKCLLLSCLLYAASHALQIPEDLPDGDYRITHTSAFETETKPLVERYNPLAKRWHPVRRSSKEGGTGELNIFVDENAPLPIIESIAVDVHHDTVLFPADEEVKKGCFGQIPHPLPEDDYAASKQSLYNFCTSFGFHKAHVEIALRGRVMVYVCTRNWPGRHASFCSETEFEAVEGIMNNTCGVTGAGWVHIGGTWGKEYGRAWRGTPICPDVEGKYGDMHELKGFAEKSFLDKGGKKAEKKPEGGTKIHWLDKLEGDKKERGETWLHYLDKLDREKLEDDKMDGPTWLHYLDRLDKEKKGKEKLEKEMLDKYKKKLDKGQKD
ncbi:hypothetical protein B0T10DRAFT_83696 [Thelonectria olida]|uniref:Uncharacterized protein n=1 Tax=Thelonectria olida TaxID=1576542 RepID=A0A9P8W2R5_9HYPO|nr:hypothetical protein B0T10DRAFT_83696 [Thelonectria olida]